MSGLPGLISTRRTSMLAQLWLFDSSRPTGIKPPRAINYATWQRELYAPFCFMANSLEAKRGDSSPGRFFWRGATFLFDSSRNGVGGHGSVAGFIESPVYMSRLAFA